MPKDPPPSLDALDRSLLEALGDDARVTNQALAERAGVAPGSGERRMRRRTAAVVTTAVAASVVAWAPIASASYTFVASWGGLGTGPGQFNQPRGLAVSSSGDVYVADSLNNRVQRFAADGTFLGQWGGAGAGDGQFQGPYGVTIGPTGDVFVVDRNNHRVQRFSPSGAFVSTFGSVGAGPGQLSHPSA